MRLIDRTGLRYGRLLVEERLPAKSKKDANARWLCRCDCGTPVVVYGQDLARGKQKSCGCLNAERIVQHGMSHMPVYRVWQAMLQRCGNPNSQSWADYGGRGIEVCQRWHRFQDFIADMGVPSRGQSLDRLDVNGDYCKENCRWTDIVKQANNKRSNRMIEFNGERRTLAEWADRYGLDWSLLRARLDYHHWPIEQALTTAIGGAALYEFRGLKKTLAEWADDSGISLETLRSRVGKLGWTIEEALTTKVASKGDLYEFRGEKKTLQQWAEVTGIPWLTLRKRFLEYGWSNKRALTTPARQRRLIPDENGEVTSLRALAIKRGLDPSAVYARVMKLGWSIEEALGTPITQTIRKGLN